MSRLAENDLPEFRLRLRASVGRWNARRLAAEDVEALIEEVVECWAGNLPEWANDDQRPSWEHGGDRGPPMAHLDLIERRTDLAVARAAAAKLDGNHKSAAIESAVADELFAVLEELEDDKEICTKDREETCCADVAVACGAPRHSTCAAGRDPTGSAPTAHGQ